MTASRIPDIEAFEERAAIAEYDGRLARLQASLQQSKGLPRRAHTVASLPQPSQIQAATEP